MTKLDKLSDFTNKINLFIYDVSVVRFILDENDPLYKEIMNLITQLDELNNKINTEVFKLKFTDVYSFKKKPKIDNMFSLFSSNSDVTLTNNKMLYSPPHVRARTSSGESKSSESKFSKVKSEGNILKFGYVSQNNFQWNKKFYEIEIKDNMYLDYLTAGEQCYLIKNDYKFNDIRFYYKNPKYYGDENCGLYNLKKGDSVYFIGDDHKLYYLNQDDILEHAVYSNHLLYWKEKN